MWEKAMFVLAVNIELFVLYIYLFSYFMETYSNSAVNTGHYFKFWFFQFVLNNSTNFISIIFLSIIWLEFCRSANVSLKHFLLNKKWRVSEFSQVSNKNLISWGIYKGTLFLQFRIVLRIVFRFWGKERETERNLL